MGSLVQIGDNQYSVELIIFVCGDSDPSDCLVIYSANPINGKGLELVMDNRTSGMDREEKECEAKVAATRPIRWQESTLDPSTARSI